MNIPKEIRTHAEDALFEGGIDSRDQVVARWARHQALLDAHALCTTTTDAAAISRLIEAERQEVDR